MSFLSSQAPSVEKRQFRRLFFCLFEDFGPILFRVLKKGVAVHVIHQHNPDQRGQPRETPRALDAFLQHHEQQVGDKRHPYLYLYGIGAFSIEIPQREVLFQLLEQQFYFPSLAVYGDYFRRIHLHVVRQQRDKPWFLPVDVGIRDYSRLVPYLVSPFGALGEYGMPHPGLHKAFRKHDHRVRNSFMDKVLLHFRDINDALPCQLFKLRVVDIRPVHRDDIAIGITGGLEHEAVVGRGGGETDV